LKENMRLQIEAREKMQAELNKQEEQKKLEAKQAEQMALAAAKAVESYLPYLFAIPVKVIKMRWASSPRERETDE
jgi:hypothetical protein